MNKIIYALFSVCLCSFALSAQSSLVITEFNFRSATGGNDDLEYIELYNNSNTVFDLSGHKLLFGTNVRTTFPTGTTIQPNGVLVLASNAVVLQNTYRLSFLPYQAWANNQGMSNQGTTIKITDANDVILDSVAYTPSSVPTGVNGGGYSAELCDITADNSTTASNSNWTASANQIMDANNNPVLVAGLPLYGSPGIVGCNYNTTPATPPANDNCADAIALTLNAPAVVGSVENATQTSTSGCSSNTMYDVWYSFTATTTGNHVVSATTDVDLDIVLQVFSGSCGSLSPINCDDSMVDGTEYITVSAVAGQTYYVRIYEYDGDGSNVGTFEVDVTSASASGLPNDECSGATPFVLGGGAVTGSTQYATPSNVPLCTGATGYDVWYSFIAPHTGRYFITAQTPAGYDVVLEALTGSCANLTSIDCRDYYAEGVESFGINVVAGETYYIRIHEYSGNGSNASQFTLNIQESILGAVNDECTNAIAFNTSTTCDPVLGSVSEATFSGLSNSCAASATEVADVWYSFQANNTTATIAALGVGFMDIIMEFYSGSCGNLVSLACIDDTYPFWDIDVSEEIILNNLTIGETYYIRIYDYDAGLGDDVDYMLCVVSTPAPNPCANVTIAATATGCDANATASATGGVAPYTYAWSNGSTTAAVNNLVVGTSYTLTVTDANGCTGTATYTATACTPTNPCANVTIAATATGCDANATASATGGVAPYTYAWSNGATTAAANNLVVGTSYTLTVTDANGCTGTATYTATACNPTNPCANVTIAATATGCDANATASATGGVAPYTYAWSNGITTAAVNNLVVGTSYTLTVTDANGCTGTATYTATACNPTNPCANVTITYTLAACDNTARVELVSGGTAPYTYAWSTGASTDNVTGLTVGDSYSFTITDANGCTATETFVQQLCPAVNQVAAGFQMNVYPNPAHQNAILTLETIHTVDLRIELVNVMGQVMYSQEVTQQALANYDLPIANFTSGVYFVKVSSKEGVATMRLIIAK